MPRKMSLQSSYYRKRLRGRAWPVRCLQFAELACARSLAHAARQRTRLSTTMGKTRRGIVTRSRAYLIFACHQKRCIVASRYGFPPALSYVFNLTNMAEGGTPIEDGNKYLNASAMAAGLIGGHLPVVIYYYPVRSDSPYLKQPVQGSRYWTMVAAPTPDMQGSREQGACTCAREDRHLCIYAIYAPFKSFNGHLVTCAFICTTGIWFRFQQVECKGNMTANCHLVGKPQYERTRYSCIWQLLWI